MTRDDITRMAQEAGFVGMDGEHGALRRFAALVAAAEREACARVCEQKGMVKGGEVFAARIRAREEK